jgi:hypothetical protein
VLGKRAGVQALLRRVIRTGFDERWTPAGAAWPTSLSSNRETKYMQYSCNNIMIWHMVTGGVIE